MNEMSQIGLRKADFWTSLVLLAVGGGMLANALSMPLEGTYAGVANAWYVSPALFPMIVAIFIVGLAGLLLANAIRAGGARAALQGLAGFPASARHRSGSGDFWLVSGTLAAYIYVLVPRIDFIAATTFLLFTLVSVYDLGSAGAARRSLVMFVGTAAIVAALALSGIDFAPRSSAAYARDAFVWAAAASSMLIVAMALRGDAEPRRRLSRCLAVSVLTPLILGASFKYGLLVPLPNEGITVALLDAVRYGLPAAF